MKTSIVSNFANRVCQCGVENPQYRSTFVTPPHARRDAIANEMLMYYLARSPVKNTALSDFCIRTQVPTYWLKELSLRHRPLVFGKMSTCTMTLVVFRLAGEIMSVVNIALKQNKKLIMEAIILRTVPFEVSDGYGRWARRWYSSWRPLVASEQSGYYTARCIGGKYVQRPWPRVLFATRCPPEITRRLVAASWNRDG